jgi:hypothetical protein
LLSALVALTASCSSRSGDAVTVNVSGSQGTPIPATKLDDLLLVNAQVGGVSGALVVDTGSPIVALDPSAFSTAGFPAGGGAASVASMTIGGLTFHGQPVVAAPLVTSPDPTVPLAGSLGCGVLCAFAVSLDYRGSTVTLGASTPPNGVAPPVAVPFSLEGGGTETLADVPGTVVFPPSRIVVTATIEGAAHPLVVDTGSSTVLLRESIFTSLVADGRAEITDVGTQSVGASSTSAVTRVRSFGVGGAVVSGLVAAADPSLDASLDSLATEIGGPVDGLVGGSFLREFFVTVDYQGGLLDLRRYTEGGPTYDVFDRVGVAVTPAMGSTPATVTAVFAGTDAATHGVSVGDAVVSIAGTPLANLGETAINALLSGAVGSTKTVTFGATASPLLSMQTVTLGVSDVLPL